MSPTKSPTSEIAGCAQTPSARILPRAHQAKVSPNQAQRRSPSKRARSYHDRSGSGEGVRSPSLSLATGGNDSPDSFSGGGAGAALPPISPATKRTPRRDAVPLLGVIDSAAGSGDVVLVVAPR